MLIQSCKEKPPKNDSYAIEVVRPCGGKLPDTCRVGFSSLAHVIARSLQDTKTDETVVDLAGKLKEY